MYEWESQLTELAQPQTLAMQVADDVENLKRTNKALSEWITKLANKLWIYAHENNPIADRPEKHPTPIEPNFQSLRYMTADNIREYENLVDNLYSIWEKL